MFKKLKKLVVASVLLLSSFLVTKPQSVQANWTNNGTITLTNAADLSIDIIRQSYYSASNGWNLTCGNDGVPEPAGIKKKGDSTTINFSDLQLVTDENVKKFLYYGWNGPGFSQVKDRMETAWARAKENPQNRADMSSVPNVASYLGTHHMLSWYWNGVSGKKPGRSFAAGDNKPMRGTDRENLYRHILSLPNAPASFKAYVWKHGNHAQDMFLWRSQYNADLKLKKQSANKTLSDLSTAGYSLQNAQYGVYGSEVHAQRDISRLGTLTTDAEGNTNTLSLPMGKTYYVKELVAPKGFELDDIVHPVYLDANKTLNVTDEPKTDPFNLFLEKNDGKGTKLPGAEFEVKYYAGLFNTAEELANQTPLRTWVFRTDNNGVVKFADTHKIRGDELFKSESGTTVGLIGTYTYQEIKAPEGYLLDNTIFVSQLKEDDTTTGRNVVYNAPRISNQVKQGKIAITKQMDKNINGKQQDGLKVAGANIAFDIVSNKTNQVVATITTDENGYAETPLLDYGSYTVKEKASAENEGYHLVQDFTVNIQEHGKVYHYALENFIRQSKLKIVKIDADTKQTVPLAGFAFKLQDDKGNFISQTIPYPREKVVDTFITDETGTVQLPENLLYGNYKIVEMNTPQNSGYVLNTTALPVTITGNETVLTVEFENQKQKLIVELDKLAEQVNGIQENTKTYTINNETKTFTTKSFTFSEQHLAGVTFELRKKDGTVLQRKTTTNEKLVFDPVDLGTYDLVEVATATGYVLNSQPVEVVGTPQAQTIRYDIQSATIINQRQIIQLEVNKIMEAPQYQNVDNPLKDVVFGLYTKQPITKNNFTLEKDTLVATSGIENGKATFNVDIAGEYYVKELTTNTVYVLSPEVIDYTITHDENATSTIKKITPTTVENTLKRVSVKLVKVDANQTDKTLAGAEFKLVAIKDDETIEIGNYVTDDNGEIHVSNLEVNAKYKFVETKAPSGYIDLGTELVFDVPAETPHQETLTYTLNNEKIPEIKTQAHGKDQQVQEEVVPQEKTPIIETAIIKDLVIGRRYKTTISLVDLATKTIIEKRDIEFIAEGTTHTITETFEVDGFKHNDGVVFAEDLYREKDGQYILIAEHNKDYDDKEQTVPFKKHGKVTVFKIDSTTKEKIKRYVKFGLYLNGELVAEKTSDTGIIVFDRLIEGYEYEVKELDAPLGYVKSDEVLRVVITKENTDLSFEYENHLPPTIKIPVPTNDTTETVLFIATLVAAIIGLVVLRDKQNR